MITQIHHAKQDYNTVTPDSLKYEGPRRSVQQFPAPVTYRLRFPSNASPPY